jgi:hypothetical protein
MHTGGYWLLTDILVSLLDHILRPMCRWERIILRRIFRKCDVGAWTGSNWPWTGTGGGHL